MARLEAWGYSRNAVKEVLNGLREQGLLELTNPHNALLHRAASYRIPHECRARVAASPYVWPSFNAFMERRRPRRRVTVGRADLQVLLSRLSYAWNGPAAVAALRQMDGAARLWACVASFPHGDDLRPNWKESPKCGRIYSSRPNVQGIPHALRLPSILGGPLWNVDIHAEHANITRILAGHEPLPTLWRDLAERADAPAKQCKGIVNAYLGGQTAGKWAHNERVAGREPDHDAYQRIMTAARDDFGIDLEYFDDGDALPVNVLQRIGADIMFDALADMARRGLPPVLLPLHDGLVIGGERHHAAAAVDALQDASRARLGVALSVNVDALPDAEPPPPK